MTERERILLALEKARTYQDESYDIWYNADDVEKTMEEYAEQRIREELIGLAEYLNVDFAYNSETKVNEYLTRPWK